MTLISLFFFAVHLFLLLEFPHGQLVIDIKLIRNEKKNTIHNCLIKNEKVAAHSSIFLSQF